MTVLPANFKYINPAIVDSWHYAGDPQPERGQIVAHKVVS
jgi:hypothetical protein